MSRCWVRRFRRIMWPTSRWFRAVCFSRGTTTQLICSCRSFEAHRGSWRLGRRKPISTGKKSNSQPSSCPSSTHFSSACSLTIIMRWQSRGTVMSRLFWVTSRAKTHPLTTSQQAFMTTPETNSSLATSKLKIINSGHLSRCSLPSLSKPPTWEIWPSFQRLFSLKRIQVWLRRRIISRFLARNSMITSALIQWILRLRSPRVSVTLPSHIDRPTTTSRTESTIGTLTKRMSVTSPSPPSPRATPNPEPGSTPAPPPVCSRIWMWEQWGSQGWRRAGAILLRSILMAVTFARRRKSEGGARGVWRCRW